MRLMFVHGINNEGNSSAKIVHDWTSSIEAALDAPGLFASVERMAPFYGDVLKELEGAKGSQGIIKQGISAESEDAQAFFGDALDEIAASAGISPEALIAETRLLGLEQPETMGCPPHDRKFIALVRLIEAISPLQGNVALRLLNQAYIYLKQPAATAAIDAIVGSALATEAPTVVVAHSLGTVVSFKLLRALGMAHTPRAVPFYVTLGSPLAIKSVKSALGKPRIKPAGVDDWLNARDPDDFVTLGLNLDAKSFAANIRNIADIGHSGDDAHAIDGYLSDRRVAEAIAKACGVWPRP
jgi:hypothetical protein